MSIPAVCLALATLSLASQPNIVLIVADDLGYADISCNGNGGIPTPNIDSIASSGIRFTSGYSACPVSAPSRAALMTGMYPQRFGFERNPPTTDGDRANYGLPTNVQTLPERLRHLGYRTGAVGKWHLGERADSTPIARGFDSFYGFLEGGSSYWPQSLEIRTLYDDETPTLAQSYLTDEFTNKAEHFIASSAGSPFFLYLAYTAPHSPLEAPQSMLDRFQAFVGKRKSVAAMVSSMDDGVGRLLASLRQRKLLANTLIFFISDNGGVRKDLRSDNSPLRGQKGSVLEGGIRIPFLASWPARFAKNKTLSSLVSTMDISATALAAAGSTDYKTGFDGKSLLPMCRENEPSTLPVHADLFWRYGSKLAVRSGRWKYVWYQSPLRVHEALFDLEANPAEWPNLIAKRPNVTEWLKAKWAVWNSQMVDPLW